MSQVSILIIDDDRASQTALRQVLDSEGWKVRIVPLMNQALPALAAGNWALVIVNVAMTGLDGPLFQTLKELAQAPPVEDGRRRVRVLFLVPQLASAEAQPALEREQLPYVLKPLHLHDFLEKVSDLLMETEAIPNPIRRVRHDREAGERRKREKRAVQNRRETAMFASREDYMMTEEEIAEFERQEKEEQERKKKQKKQQEQECN